VFDRQVLGTTLEASLLVSLGELRRELFGTALWHFDAGWSRLTPILTVRVGSEEVRRFGSDGTELAKLGATDGRLTASLEFWTGTAWRIRLGADGVAWSADSVSRRAVAGGSLRIQRQGLRGPDVTGDFLATGRFQLASAAAMWRLGRRPWSVVPTLRTGWAWGDDIPIQWTYPLGGEDGFPGLHLGERRAERELSGSVRLGRSLAGPLEARLLVAAGSTWSPGAVDSDWIGGVRAGLGADTPAGPIEVGYGVATTGRRALFIRIGKRF
jgi:hypothetical protein